MNIHIYYPIDQIKEELCLEFLRICEKLQPKGSFHGVHYTDIMLEMHVGFKKLQSILNSISHNWGYFKVKYGYTMEGWCVNVDRHKRLVVDGSPVLRIRVENIKDKVMRRNNEHLETMRMVDDFFWRDIDKIDINEIKNKKQ